MDTTERASTQKRLFLRKSVGRLSAGTRIRLRSLTEDGQVIVEAQIQDTRYNADGKEIYRKHRWHQETISPEYLVVRRPRIKVVL